MDGGAEVLYTADGVIKRRPRAGGEARPIAFSADVAFTRAAFTPKRRNFAPEGPQAVRGLMHPTIAPDGSRVVFAALGDLWTVSAAGGEAVPERLTNDVFIEMNPVWSPDGQALAYSSDRGGEMDLWLRDLRTGTDRRLAPGGEKAAWSPDGTRLAFLDPASQLRVVDVKSLEGRQVHERLNEPGRPSWSPDGRAVVMSALRPYSSRFREGTNQVLWVQVDPNPASTGRDAFAPDRWFESAAAQVDRHAREPGAGVVAGWPPDGGDHRRLPARLSGLARRRPDRAAPPPVRRSGELALVDRAIPATSCTRRSIGFASSISTTGAYETSRRACHWEARRTSGTTITTVHAGRLFDGRNTGAREAVDIVIEGNRIRQVEPHRDDLHRGTVVDASGQTVLPGLIESHTHLSKGYGEVLGRIWLSFGITTIRNPAANPFEANEDREAIDSGVRIGPRVVTTGEPLDGTRIYYPGGVALDSGALVEAYMARAQALGFDFVKTYVRLPDLIQKRIIEAAHQAGMPVTSHEIYPAVAYGADGVEHIRGTSRRGFSPKMSETRRTYKDVVDLLASSGMTLTPTIGIQGGHQVLTLRDGAWLDDVRLARLFPASAVEPSRALRAKRGRARRTWPAARRWSRRRSGSRRPWCKCRRSRDRRHRLADQPVRPVAAAGAGALRPRRPDAGRRHPHGHGRAGRGDGSRRGPGNHRAGQAGRLGDRGRQPAGEHRGSAPNTTRDEGRRPLRARRPARAPRPALLGREAVIGEPRSPQKPQNQEPRST